MSTSGQVIDTDLAPANIKSGVNIFGVEGDYAGHGGIQEFEHWAPYLAMEQLNNNINDRPPGAYYACVDNTNYVYVIYVTRDNPYGSPNNLFPTVYRLSKTNGDLTKLTYATLTSGSNTAVIGGVYTDGDYIIINSSSWYSNNYAFFRAHQYEIATDTWTMLHEDYLTSRTPPAWWMETLPTEITNGTINGFTFSSVIWPAPYPSSRAWIPTVSIV